MSSDTVNIKISIHGERITRDKLNLGICQLISYRSQCARAKVGCVIVKTYRIVSTGYNGSLSSLSCQEGCDTSVSCKHAVHAEVNAISFAARAGISLQDTTLYCTYSPCYNCAKMIISAGIVRVVYEKRYNSDNGDGLRLLKDHNVDTDQICLTD
jgi:dCMP deaminase